MDAGITRRRLGSAAAPEQQRECHRAGEEQHDPGHCEYTVEVKDFAMQIRLPQRGQRERENRGGESANLQGPAYAKTGADTT